MLKRNYLVAALALAAPAVFAQFDFGGGSSAPTRPWAEFKLPKKTMKLDFRNANLDMVISLYSRTSGVTIVKDPAVQGTVTLTTAKAVPLDEAFEILNAAISVRNAEMRKEGNVLVIRARQQRQQGGMANLDPRMLQSMMGGGEQPQSELRVYPIKLASASQVARVINEVFVQQGQQQGGFPFPSFNFGGGGGRGGMRFGGFGRSNNTQATVRASSDDFSNTVIVNAPRDTHRQVGDIIKEIDKQTDLPTSAKVYKLEFASSDEMQPVIQNLLVANQPQGRGASGSANRPIDQRFSFFGGFGGGGQQQRQQQAQVISEPRTNSIIVTTTDDNQALVASVVKELDTEIKLENTTFVFPLDNARADQVATLVRQAFGTRQGTNAGFNQGTNRNTGTLNQRNRTNNNFNQGGNRGGLNNLNQNSNELELSLDDPDADAGELETAVAVQGGFFQGFGGFGGGQQQQNRRNAPQLGRDAQGRLVPVQDLTNQVTVIPDSNTNSLIVVTTPENAELLRQILGQLDRIPEQVMIETIIVEASLDSSDKLGVEWSFSQNPAFQDRGTQGTAATGFGLSRAGEGFRYTLGGGNLDAFLNALKTDTKFEVLSTPRIFTSNNVEAEINISQRVPFVVSQREDANGNLTFTYDFEDVGIVLTVTPRITANGYVTMDVSQTANDLQGFTDFNAPIVNQRQAQTTVAVRDGDTIVLGGIMRTTVTSTVKKVPLLGDIPILGNLFKSTDRTKQKTELLVFLTPRVVRNPDDASKLREEMQKQLSPGQQKNLGKVIQPPKTESKDNSNQQQTKPPTGGGK